MTQNCREISEMEKWAENIKMVQDQRIKLAIIAANNHYAGFGTGTVNVFRNMLGLPVAKWEDTVRDQEHEESTQDDLDVKQSTLSDFPRLIVCKMMKGLHNYTVVYYLLPI